MKEAKWALFEDDNWDGPWFIAAFSNDKLAMTYVKFLRHERRISNAKKLKLEWGPESDASGEPITRYLQTMSGRIADNINFYIQLIEVDPPPERPKQ